VGQRLGGCVRRRIRCVSRPDHALRGAIQVRPGDLAVGGRQRRIAPLFKSLGGELLGYWYVLGGVEVYVMFELPDDVTATGMAARVASSGAFASPTCTRLMTVQETLAALGGAGGATVYRAPGRPE
jgi:uncharacterized protein with GYD domain